MYKLGHVPGRDEQSDLFVHSFTLKGFFGRYATLYKSRNPGEPIRYDRGLGPAAVDLKRVATGDMERADGLPAPVMRNDDVIVSVSRRRDAMPFCWRNADADELHFVHQGRATFETEFGRLAVEPGDFVALPRNAIYRVVPESDDCLFLILETRPNLETADAYHRSHGETNAGLDLSLIGLPEPGENGHALQREYEVKTKIDGQLRSAFYDFDPAGVTVGWSGDPLVFKLSCWDVPSARLPSTPPTAAVFMTEGMEAVVTAHTPARMPGQRVGPPAHTNDYDELWFLHSTGNTERADRLGVLRWEPQGVTQPGFQPRGAAAANGAPREPDLRQMTINIDVKQRLRYTPEAEPYVVEQHVEAAAAVR